MVSIPEKTEQPLTKNTILFLNQRRVQDPLGQQNIKSLNTAYGQNDHSASRRDNIQPNNRNRADLPSAPPPQPVDQGIPNMTIPQLRNQVQKGQKMLLDPTHTPKRISARMGWNVLNSSCDVDVSAFLLKNGKVLGDSWFVFYGQESSPDGSTVFSLNALPDRERISIDFTKLNSDVDKIVFILTINEAFIRRLNFSMIKDAYIRIIDDTTGQALVSFKIDEYYPNVISMTIGEVYLHKGEWKFNAVGNGVGKDLAGLCQLYGVQVE